MKIIRNTILNYKDKKSIYKIKAISPLKIAKAMDSIIELCMKYYIGESAVFGFGEIESELWKKILASFVGIWVYYENNDWP